MGIRAIVVLVVVGALCGPVGARRARVLVESGTLAKDGAGLHAFRDPVLTAPDRLLFKAETDRIAVDEAGEPRTLIATGMPLPGGDGTYDSLSTPLALYEGRFVFTAGTNRSGVETMLGRWSAGTVEVLAENVRLMRSGEANAAGDFVYESRGRVHLWRDQSRMLLEVTDVEVYPKPRIQASPVINERSSLAFVDDRHGIFRWRIEDGLVALPASPGLAFSAGYAPTLRRVGRNEVDIGEDDTVAFVGGVPRAGTAQGVVLCHADGTTVVPVTTGDAVAGRPVGTIYANDLRFDADGGLRFWASLLGLEGVQRLIARNGTVEIEPEPSPPAVASSPYRMTGSALYERKGDGIRRVVGAGDALADGSVVHEVGPAAATETTTAIGVTLRDAAGYQTGAILRDRPAGPVRLVSSGDRAASGEVFVVQEFGGYDYQENYLAIDDERLVFVGRRPSGIAAIFEKRPGTRARLLVTADDRMPGGGRFASVDELAVGPAGLAFVASIDPEGNGAFLLREGRIRTLARSGQRAPGTGGRHILKTFAPMVAGSRVAVRATLVEGNEDILLASDPSGRMVRVDRTDPDDPQNEGDHTFAITSEVAVEASGYRHDDHFLVVWSGRRSRPLLARDEPVLGGTAEYLGLPPDLAVRGRRAVLTADLSADASARRAILAVTLPERRER